MNDIDMKSGAKMRMAALKMQHREKQDSMKSGGGNSLKGVAVESYGGSINMERAYKAHHEGADMKSVMLEMGMPREFA